MSSLTALDILLIGLLSGAGLGGGLTWLGLRTRHRDLAAETAQAHVRAGAATRAALACLRGRRPAHRAGTAEPPLERGSHPADPSITAAKSTEPSTRLRPDQPAQPELVQPSDPVAPHRVRVLIAASTTPASGRQHER
jgi:hypothetical protein